MTRKSQNKKSKQYAHFINALKVLYHKILNDNVYFLSKTNSKLINKTQNGGFRQQKIDLKGKENMNKQKIIYVISQKLS